MLCFQLGGGGGRGGQLWKPTIQKGRDSLSCKLNSVSDLSAALIYNTQQVINKTGVPPPTRDSEPPHPPPGPAPHSSVDRIEWNSVTFKAALVTFLTLKVNRKSFLQLLAFSFSSEIFHYFTSCSTSCSWDLMWTLRSRSSWFISFI